MKASFEVIAHPAATVTEVRLLRAEAGVVPWVGTVGADGQLQLVQWRPQRQASGAPTATEQAMLRLSGRPGWDAMALPGGGWRVLSIEAGSARAPLSLQTVGASDTVLVEPADQSGAFMAPRFVRDGSPQPPITALDVMSDRPPTWYRPAGDGRYGARRALPAAEGVTVQDLRLLPAGPGYLMVVQSFVPQAHREFVLAGQRTLLRTGQLSVQRLDADGRKVGEAWMPFGTDTVLQFDADADPTTGRIAVLATTLQGWQLVAAPAAAIGAPPTTSPVMPGATPLRDGAESDSPLHSPSILASRGSFALALLADAGQPAARVWLGRWTPQP